MKIRIMIHALGGHPGDIIDVPDDLGRALCYDGRGEYVYELPDPEPQAVELDPVTDELRVEDVPDIFGYSQDVTPYEEEGL